MFHKRGALLPRGLSDAEELVDGTKTCTACVWQSTKLLHKHEPERISALCMLTTSFFSQLRLSSFVLAPRRCFLLQDRRQTCVPRTPPPTCCSRSLYRKYPTFGTLLYLRECKTGFVKCRAIEGFQFLLKHFQTQC